ncbi:TetR/AcrR family transcriptional regulator [Nocardia asteroides]|uniref:TetR/AcrR family transcriptional regulator n=1 Tax=Nocardia asteroides TaxID=1824 RepID=UPI00343FAE17
MTARSLRARVREEMTEEIKAAARRHLATQGADLSLRAVARDLDIVASALYRYFPNRDALLTALITEAYEALAAAATAAEAAVPRDDLPRRWHAIWQSVRAWGLAHPAEYGLLYGTPVPGYSAPPNTVAPAAAIVLLLARVVADGGERLAPIPATVPDQLHADLAVLIEQQPMDIGADRLARVFAGWTQLFGLISFEVFGRLNETIAARDTYFDHQCALMAELVGLPVTPIGPRANSAATA